MRMRITWGRGGCIAFNPLLAVLICCGLFVPLAMCTRCWRASNRYTAASHDVSPGITPARLYAALTLLISSPLPPPPLPLTPIRSRLHRRPQTHTPPTPHPIPPIHHPPHRPHTHPPQHDEASPSFVDMIDQTTLGHRFLLSEFNVTPRTTWQVSGRGGGGVLPYEAYRGGELTVLEAEPALQAGCSPVPVTVPVPTRTRYLTPD